MNNCINLVVVDNQDNYANLIKDYIDICNYKGKIEVSYQDNVKNALKEVAKDPSSIVILDAYIDDANSIDILNSLNNQNITTFLVSDNPSSEIKNAAINHGASEFLIKRYDVEDLDPLFEMILKYSKDDVVLN